LFELGARWTGNDDDAPYYRPGQGANAYVRRIHLRYDAASFPEDLVLMETPDRSNFQGRYVLRHPWSGGAACAAGERYRAGLPVRFKQEAKNLAGLTGWSQAEIESRMEADGQPLQGNKVRPRQPARPIFDIATGVEAALPVRAGVSGKDALRCPRLETYRSHYSDFRENIARFPLRSTQQRFLLQSDNLQCLPLVL